LFQRVATRVRGTALTKFALLVNDAEYQEDDDGGRNQNGGEQKSEPARPPTVTRRVHDRILGLRRLWLLS
jgi:hypothetical protein